LLLVSKNYIVETVVVLTVMFLLRLFPTLSIVLVILLKMLISIIIMLELLLFTKVDDNVFLPVYNVDTRMLCNA